MVENNRLDYNTHHFFKSPRDVEQIGSIGRQLNNPQFPKESYELATKQPFGCLLIDLDPKTLEVLRYCSNIVPLIETRGKSFQKILSKQTGLREKIKIFGRESELLKTVGLSCYLYLMKSLYIQKSSI